MTKLSDLEAKRERLIAKSKGAKNILDNIIRGISELDGQIEEAKAEPEFSFGDRVLVREKPSGDWVKGIFIGTAEPVLCNAKRFRVGVEGDKLYWNECKPDPDQRTLEFVAHDGGDKCPLDDGINIVFLSEVYNTPGGSIFMSTTDKNGDWSFVKYYAIKPEWMSMT